MLTSIVIVKPATRGCLRLEPKWQAVESGLSNVARRVLTGLPVYRADLNPSRIDAEHGNAVSPGHAVRGRPNRKAGKRSQHGEDRRSQGRFVMSRICPRRSGLSLQEKPSNHP